MTEYRVKHYEQMCTVCVPQRIMGVFVLLTQVNNRVNTLELQFISQKGLMVGKHPDITVDMVNRNKIGL